MLAALLATFNLKFRANIFIAGIAVTFLAYGLTALLLKGVLGQEGVFQSNQIPNFPTIDIPLVADIPVLGPLVSGHTILVYVAYLSVPVVAVFPLPHALGTARPRRRRGGGRGGDSRHQRRRD